MGTEADVVVVGGGAMGTAAARALAMKGRETVLLERFSFGHANGSSGGPTRVFRLVYDHPDYVRMAQLALRAWRELEDAAGEPLLIAVPSIDVGEHGRRSAASLTTSGVEHRYVTAAEAMERWPAIRFPLDAEMYIQEDAGVCLAERTVRAQARLAAELGATVREGVKVASVRAVGEGVEVATADGERIRADTAVVTAGPWARDVLATAGIDLPLVPSLEQVTYFTVDPGTVIPVVIDRRPDPDHPRYWVPDPIQPGTLKIAIHRSGPEVDPEDGPFPLDPRRRDIVLTYTAAHLPSARPTGITDTCLYTNTPDEDFLIDRVGPIVVGSPCSGHGFKFAPLIGEQLARLAVGEAATIDLTRFSASRAALRG